MFKPDLPPAPAVPGGVHADDVSTVEEAVALTSWIGKKWLASHWVTEILNPVLNPIEGKTGKRSSGKVAERVYGDLAGVLGIGLCDAVRAIEINGEIVWEGNRRRPTAATDPDYHYETIIPTGSGGDWGTFRVYWGRADAPVDTFVLGPAGAADSAQEHPAYRDQPLLVVKKLKFGDNTYTAPTVRVMLERFPKPAIGTFPEQANDQGESLIAYLLELLTTEVGGANLPTSYFTSATWEAMSSEIMDVLGHRHSNFLDRPGSWRQNIEEILEYIDGFLQLQDAKIVPKRFPHTESGIGAVTELSLQDLTELPEISGVSLEGTINRLSVKCREWGDAGARKLKEAVVHANSPYNRALTGQRLPDSADMLGFVDTNQAVEFAQERVAAEGMPSSSGRIKPRRSRAVHPDGTRMLAGDNLHLDYTPFSLDAVYRIVERVDHFDGQVEMEIVNERGIFPSPYQPPSDQTPDLDTTEPLAITRSRVIEVPFDPSPQTGKIHVWVLAMRPKGRYVSPYTALESQDVIGMQVHYSGDDLTYDLLGSQNSWATRGDLESDIDDSSTTVVVDMDAANLDLESIVSHNAEEKADNTLLLFIGNEIMSCGQLSISAFEYTFTVTRGIFGTTATAHSVNADAFVAFRDELIPWTHERFLPAVTRYFKLQPFTRVNLFELSSITDASTGKVTQLFATQSAAPAIVLDPENPTAVVAGVEFRVQGGVTFSHLGGDLQPQFVVWTVGPTRTSRWTGGLMSKDPIAGVVQRFDIPITLKESGSTALYLAAFDHRQILPFNGVTQITQALTVGAQDKVPPPASQNVAGFRMPAEAGYLLQWDWPIAPDIDYCWIYWTDRAGDTFADIVDQPNNRLWGTRDEDGARMVGGRLVVDAFIPWSLARINQLVTNYFFIAAVDFSGNLGAASAKITISAGAGRPTVIAEAKILPLLAPLSVIDINSDNTVTPATVSMRVETVKNVPAPAYQWQHKAEGGSFVNIVGETAITLTRTAAQVVALGARGLFRCYVDDGTDPTINGYTNECQIDVNRYNHIGDPTETGDFARLVNGKLETEVGSGDSKWMVKDGKASFGDHTRLMHQSGLGRIFAGSDPDGANPFADDYANMYATASQAGITVGDGAGRTSYTGSAAGGCVVRHTGFDWFLRTASRAERAFFDESTGILKYSDLAIEGYNGPTKVWGIDEDGNSTFANTPASSGGASVAGTFSGISVGTGGITITDGDLTVMNGPTVVFNVDESLSRATISGLVVGGGGIKVDTGAVTLRGSTLDLGNSNLWIYDDANVKVLDFDPSAVTPTFTLDRADFIVKDGSTEVFKVDASASSVKVLGVEVNTAGIRGLRGLPGPRGFRGLPGPRGPAATIPANLTPASLVVGTGGITINDGDLTVMNGPTVVFNVDESLSRATVNSLVVGGGGIRVDSGGIVTDDLEVGTGGLLVDDGDIVVENGSTRVFHVDESENRATARRLSIGSGSSLLTIDACFVGRLSKTWSSNSVFAYWFSLAGRGFSSAPDMAIGTATKADDLDYSKILVSYDRGNSRSTSFRMYARTIDGTSISGDIEVSVLAMDFS